MARVAFPIPLDAQTRNTLDKFIHSSSTPQSLALRCRIVLAAAGGPNNRQIAAALKIPPITVGKWRRSFALNGLEGLRDAPRSGRPPRHDADTRHRVQTRVCQLPEDQGRWTVRTLAAEVGLPASTVHAMLVAAQLQPHRIRTFTFSPDPDFEAKLLDIIGLYRNPPENALVAVCGRENGHSGAPPNATGTTAEGKQTPRLDQRVRPSRHTNVVGRPRDCHRQSGRPCPGPADHGGLFRFSDVSVRFQTFQIRSHVV